MRRVVQPSGLLSYGALRSRVCGYSSSTQPAFYLSNSSTSVKPVLQVIPRPEHNISRADISSAALKVLYRLRDGGFEGYLVGGSVRDLLLGKHPKDFDIATSATPEEVHKLFNNSRLIGRRFRLVHVRFGREIIEVATFRAPAGHEDDDHHVAEDSGRVLRDNVWGNLEEDAMRRDFTINSLYYGIGDFAIRDFAGGVADIEARQLRLIGDPEQRYREDPVRMLRATRFAAKLDFNIEKHTAEPIERLASLLDNIPSARLFDEFGKLFQSGHALASWQQLQKYDLTRHLFSLTAMWLNNDPDGLRLRFIEQALRNTDERVVQEKPITPMFLFAVFLWGPVSGRARQLQEDEDMPEVQSLVSAGAELTAIQCARIAVPKRFSYPMREIMQMQPRFEQRQGKKAMSLLGHRRFRAAYDLYALRTQLGEVSEEALAWWTDVQTNSEPEQKKAFSGARPGGRRRRRPRKKPGNKDSQ